MTVFVCFPKGIIVGRTPSKKTAFTCNKEEISKAVSLLETVNENDNVCVIGNKDAIENCKDQLDEIFTF